MKHSKNYYKNLPKHNGYEWYSFDKGKHFFKKKEAKGYSVIKVTDKDIENGNFEFMAQHEMSRMAKGGVTEHGLRKGDTITDDMFWSNEAVVRDSQGIKHKVNLEKGKRYANGGNMEDSVVRKGDYWIVKNEDNANFPYLVYVRDGAIVYKAESKKDAVDWVKQRSDNMAKGGYLSYRENLEKEVRKLQRDLNSSRLRTYREGDNSQEEKNRQKERAVKLARFNEVLALLREDEMTGESEGEKRMGMDSMAKGGNLNVDYYSVDVDDVNGGEDRDNEFKTLAQAKKFFDKIVDKGVTSEDVPLDNVQLIKVLKNGDYEVVESKIFTEYAKGGNTNKNMTEENLKRRLKFIAEDVDRLYNALPYEVLEMPVKGWENVRTLLANIEIATDLSDNESDNWKFGKKMEQVTLRRTGIIAQDGTILSANYSIGGL